MSFPIEKARGIDIFHELLFALLGTKSAFTSYQFAIRDLFPLSEAVLLERILNLGQDYAKLKEFIENVKLSQFEEKNNGGLYMLAFAEHLNRSLEPYKTDIVNLEQDITNHPHKSLHFIWSKMHRHCELLSGLLSLVTNIVTQNTYGCIVLEHLHQILSTNIGVTRAAVAVIIDGINEILFRHILCWLMYGDLVDTKGEFFIKEIPSEDDEEEKTPFERFVLNCAMLPSHIDNSLADKILTVGQTVRFLRSNPKYLSEKGDKEERSEICIDKYGLFGEKETQIYDQMVEVREICKWNENGKMEKVVNKISSLVTLQLWTLAMQDAKLIEQLNLVNDFFLLGRGELFHEFVTQVDRQMSKSGIGNLDLNTLLRESARKVLIREETLERFSLEYVSSLTEEGSDDSEGKWTRVLVKYEAPWPLQLLFTKESLSFYNKIFRFLLRLKNIEVKLGECWLIEKSKRYGTDNLKARQLHRNLRFLINNLQYYFHVDVLNSQFVGFESVTQLSKDFERIQLAHGVFIENLTSQLFLQVDSTEKKTKNPIKKSINKLLELCEEYCVEVESNFGIDIEEEKIDWLLTRFEALVEFLLNHLTRITDISISPNSQHLLQVLLRLDYNSFFSNKFSSSLASVYF